MPTQPSAEWLAIAKAVQAAPAPVWVTILDAANKVIQATAIIVGGVWTYYKFIKGRFYRPRLEILVEGETFCKEGREYAIVSISLENVGTTKVEIQQRGTGLRVFGCTKPRSAGAEHETSLKSEIAWERIVTLAIFENHGWIESSEIIRDKLLIALPSDQIALRLDVRLVSEGLVWGGRGIVQVGGVKAPAA